MREQRRDSKYKKILIMTAMRLRVLYFWVIYIYVVLKTTFLPQKLTGRGQYHVSLLHQAKYECFNSQGINIKLLKDYILIIIRMLNNKNVSISKSSTL